jgi:type IV pilus assembly protein PilY1
MARLTLPLSLCAALSAGAQSVDLADKPLFSTTNVPGNMMLDLSVEYPTANSSAYFSSVAYSPSTLYVGYFDGGKCYSYVYNSGTPTSSYFQSYSTASSTHTCTSSSSRPLWSGNWLNYASMQGLDIFRWVLTGGNRSVDTATTTILQRSTHSGQGGSGDAPNKVLASTNETGATPFNWGTQNNTRVWGAATALWITGNTTNITGNSVTTADYKAQYCSSNCDSTSNSAKDSDGNPYRTVVYALYINVRVCDTTVSLESNCVLYNGTTYKPEGLMQQYSQTLRYGAFGYLNDGSSSREGGVLRARMAYIGPTQPVPGAAAQPNTTTKEWDGTTGIMLTNPDGADATASNGFTQSFARGVNSIATSGVMNYLNKFGYSAAAVNLSTAYKSNDPVSELYYGSMRYLKGQSNVKSYTDMTGASASTINGWVDGFPVITTWATVNGTYSSTYDPILYSCQKNFILGIGDVNTHRDGDLPGSTLIPPGASTPTEVSSDTTINVTTATNTVGTMEGTNSQLGSTYISGEDYATDYIAGMAYDAHLPLSGHGVRTFQTTDPTSGAVTTTIATASTYWLDVQEYQQYVPWNQYYYATKYGGFTVPSGYTYGTALTLDSWYNSTNTQSTGGNTPQDQPDNYYTASNATVMQAGLTSAFAKIAAENGTLYGTALAVPTPNVTSAGALSYASNYDPQSWTGQVLASTVSFAADGTPTLTQQWDARALLSSSSVTPSTRYIVTCCTNSTTAPGLPFTNAALTSNTLNARTYYASFATVPGVSTGSQSIANYILYLRGDTTKEVANGGAYRTREYRLGDIVNSKPVTVGPPSFQFYDTTNPGYAAFKSAYATRKNVVFAGANDGMLHAFDGTVGNTTSGSELFAYIPSFIYGTATTAATTGLASLGNPTGFTHHYLVDAPAGQFDVDFGYSGVSASSRGTPNWHTILIGGLGKGGNGYYALDVTDPTTWTSEAAVATKVLWEFTDPRLGYTYGTPTVVKTKKYGWTVVFTSGYNNADGMGYIFFVNPATGALLEVVSTPAGSGSTTTPLNLGVASAYVADYTDQTADAIYAGDVQGDVWRVDVTGATIGTPYPTAVQFAAFGATQPITTRPLIEIGKNSTVRYVLIGTGKLLGDSDISTSAQQSFYAMVDGFQAFGAFYGGSTPLPSGVTLPLNRSKLNQNMNPLTNGIGSNPTSVMGWYIDLPVSTNPAIAQRVNVDPFANQGYVAFIGNTPNGSVCNPGGSGAVYTFNFASGQSLLTSSSGTILSASLIGQGTDVTILGNGGILNVYTGDNKGNAFKAPTSITSAAGVVQINWRDVPSTN